MKHQTLYIGIDPGKAGGITALRYDGTVHFCEKMPPEPVGLCGLLTDCIESSVTVRACLEKVSSSPQMGVRSSFTFGEGFGSIQGALTGLLIPYDLVTPQRWQKALGCMSGGDKNVTKKRAAALFPSQRVTHAVADSLLIAEYYRRELVRVGK